MSEIQDDIAYLSQEIGPRPAGTEEEQQAALYIAEQMQTSASLSTKIEDFKCVSDPDIVRAVCFGFSFIGLVLALAVSQLSILALIFTLIGCSIYLAESAGKPILSRFLMRGASQNVISRYQPGDADGRPRRRKVVFFAHYDSGKVQKELSSPILRVLPLIKKVERWGIIAAPIVVLFKNLVLAAAPAPVVAVLSFIAVVNLIIVALPLVATALHRFGSYNEAANDNAAGVATMMEVARQISRGRVSMADLESVQREPVVHGERAARASGVVPEDIPVEYDIPANAQVVEQQVDSIAPESSPVQTQAQQAPSNAVLSIDDARADDEHIPEDVRLAVAKAAIAQMTGENVEGAASPELVARVEKERARAREERTQQIKREFQEAEAKARLEAIENQRLTLSSPAQVSSENQTAPSGEDMLEAVRGAAGTPVDLNGERDPQTQVVASASVSAVEAPNTNVSAQGGQPQTGAQQVIPSSVRVDASVASRTSETPVPMASPAASAVSVVNPERQVASQVGVNQLADRIDDEPEKDEPYVPDWFKEAQKDARHHELPHKPEIAKSRYASALDAADAQYGSIIPGQGTSQEETQAQADATRDAVAGIRDRINNAADNEIARSRASVVSASTRGQATSRPPVLTYIEPTEPALIAPIHSSSAASVPSDRQVITAEPKPVEQLNAATTPVTPEQPASVGEIAADASQAVSHISQGVEQVTVTPAAKETPQPEPYLREPSVVSRETNEEFSATPYTNEEQAEGKAGSAESASSHGSVALGELSDSVAVQEEEPAPDHTASPERPSVRDEQIPEAMYSDVDQEARLTDEDEAYIAERREAIEDAVTSAEIDNDEATAQDQPIDVSPLDSQDEYIPSPEETEEFNTEQQPYTQDYIEDYQQTYYEGNESYDQTYASYENADYQESDYYDEYASAPYDEEGVYEESEPQSDAYAYENRYVVSDAFEEDQPLNAGEGEPYPAEVPEGIYENASRIHRGQDGVMDRGSEDADAESYEDLGEFDVYEEQREDYEGSQEYVEGEVYGVYEEEYPYEEPEKPSFTARLPWKKGKLDDAIAMRQKREHPAPRTGNGFAQRVADAARRAQDSVKSAISTMRANREFDRKQKEDPYSIMGSGSAYAPDQVQDTVDYAEFDTDQAEETEGYSQDDARVYEISIESAVRADAARVAGETPVSPYETDVDADISAEEAAEIFEDETPVREAVETFETEESREEEFSQVDEAHDDGTRAGSEGIAKAEDVTEAKAEDGDASEDEDSAAYEASDSQELENVEVQPVWETPTDTKGEQGIQEDASASELPDEILLSNDDSGEESPVEETGAEEATVERAETSGNQLTQPELSSETSEEVTEAEDVNVAIETFENAVIDKEERPSLSSTIAMDPIDVSEFMKQSVDEEEQQEPQDVIGEPEPPVYESSAFVDEPAQKERNLEIPEISEIKEGSSGYPTSTVLDAMIPKVDGEVQSSVAIPQTPQQSTRAKLGTLLPSMSGSITREEPRDAKGAREADKASEGAVQKPDSPVSSSVNSLKDQEPDTAQESADQHQNADKNIITEDVSDASGGALNESSIPNISTNDAEGAFSESATNEEKIDESEQANYETEDAVEPNEDESDVEDSLNNERPADEYSEDAAAYEDIYEDEDTSKHASNARRGILGFFDRLRNRASSSNEEDDDRFNAASYDPIPDESDYSDKGEYGEYADSGEYEWAGDTQDWDAQDVSQVEDERTEEDDQLEEAPRNKRHHFWNGGAYTSGQEDRSDPSIAREVEQIYRFKNPDIDVDVWFVALGAEHSGNAGIKAFLDLHRKDLNGAIAINLEAPGVGDLSLIEEEGIKKPIKPTSRLKRHLREASSQSGVTLRSDTLTWRDSASSIINEAGGQAASIVGMLDGKPAMAAQGDDVQENIDFEQLDRAVAFLMALLRSV